MVYKISAYHFKTLVISLSLPPKIITRAMPSVNILIFSFFLFFFTWQHFFYKLWHINVMKSMWIYIRCIQKVSFPIKKKKKRTHTCRNIFIGNKYSNVSAIFQHSHHQSWDICHIVGSTFLSLCRRTLPHVNGTSVWQTSSAHHHCQNVHEDRNFLRY